MLTTDIPPNQTIYIRNVNEKIKKEGPFRLFLGYLAKLGFVLCHLDFQLASVSPHGFLRLYEFEIKNFRHCFWR